MKDPSSQQHGGKKVVAIIGAGSIGTGFAVVHASADREVVIYDVSKRQRDAVLGQIAIIAEDLIGAGLLDENDKNLVARVRVASSLEEATTEAEFIHECAPEDLDIKRDVVAAIDQNAPDNAVIASASSAIPASQIAEAIPGRSRCLVAHPGNPPFLLRTIEIVPAPFTSQWAVNSAGKLLEKAGMTPVLVQKEVRGFVFNRLQGALLREAYCLVRDGVASVEDIDCLVRDGLGLRWSVVGPFEAVDLNTRGGIGRHAKLLGPAYAAMGAERGQDDPWTEDLVQEVEAQRRSVLPLDAWEERVAWRNRRIMSLLAAREAIDEQK